MAPSSTKKRPPPSSKPTAGTTRATLGRYVALLRGINVGGNNKLPMRDLAKLFEAAGCIDVVTYIQSGNVVFAAPPKVASGISADVTRTIERRFGLRTPVVLRAAGELETVAGNNPFLARGVDANALHVMFLSDEPAKSAVANLDAQRSPPDEFVVRGREIYLCLPNGVARSKLTNAYFDAKLATTSTVRNWRTLLKLVEIANASP